MIERHELPLSTILARVPYLATLPPALAHRLSAAMIRREFEPGALIFLESAPCAGLHLIAGGRVRIFKVSPEGKEQGLHLLGPGDVFNDVATLDGGPNPASAMALEPTILWILPREPLMQAVEHSPPLARAIIEHLAARARFLVAKVEDLSFRSVTARLAKLLLEQASLTGPHDQLQRQRWMTQAEMAAQLGTAREVVGRSLRELEADGLIRVERHRIQILDRAALEARALG
ncbi:MAG: Crp/Fnr family transcriptional regulator [Ardenticatenaceae bacterium]|nr:Crp/Fnr family transcriptional regulator [Ardenticatenaceae bacterium]